jgi:hypothetical protein
MSQAGIVDVENAHPQIPTSFVTNSGTAVPIANVLEILGTVVAAQNIPLETTGSGNTVTVVAQYASANALSSGTKAGLASFNSASFTVDANGYVSLSGGSVGETITGNTGGALSPTAGNWNIVTSNSTAIFAGSGSTLTLNFGITNLILGSSGSGISGGSENCGFGLGSLASLTSGDQNAAVGYNSLNSIATIGNCAALGWASLSQCVGVGNVGCGSAAGQNITSGTYNIAIGFWSMNSFDVITTGSHNIGIGYETLNNITSGSESICIGSSAGSNYSSSETNNICIGYNVSGTSGESNVIRIGNSSAAKCFVQGVQGVSVSNTNIVTINTSTSQMGSVATVPLALGGTNADLTASNGGIFYSTASAGAILAGTATASQVLLSGASTTPSWSTATYPATAGTSGNVLTSNGTNWTSAAPAAPAGTITQYAVLVGGASSAIGSVADVATGQVLASGGVSANPAFTATPTLTSVTFGSGTALSVYAEGTFTPTVNGSSAGTTTYTNQNGYYTKIGNLVTVIGTVNYSAATGTGNLIIGGLPFTIKSQTEGSAIGSILFYSTGSTFPVGCTTYCMLGSINTTTATIFCTGSTTGGLMQMANTTVGITFTMSYQV